MALPTRYIHQVDEKAIYHDAEELILSLAELAGFNIYEVKGYNDEHEGFIIEATDKELREFLAAETASEEHEAELVDAISSSTGDDF